MRSLSIQFHLMFKRIEFKIAFTIMLLYSLFSFLINYMNCIGNDYFICKDFSSNFCFISDSFSWGIFITILPFVIVLPFATSYLRERNDNTINLIISRACVKDYFLSKVIVTFSGTCIIILIPCIINAILCSIFFPHNGNTLLGGYELPSYISNLLGDNLIYTTDYSKIPLIHLYLENPVLYRFVFLLIITLFSSLCSTFVLCISYIFPCNTYILYLPVYILFRFSTALREYAYEKAINNSNYNFINFSLPDYLDPFIFPGLNYYYFAVVCVIMAGFSIFSVVYIIKHPLHYIQGR